MSEKLLIRNQYACFLCTGWMFQVRLRSTAWSGHPFLLVSSHLTSLPQLFFSVYSFIAIHCLFLLLVPHSSFLICSAPSGSCSLIYFYRAAWKESRQEQKRNQQPFLSSQSPLWILLLSDCLVFLVFNEFSSVSHRFPKRFHSSPSVLFDPLHLFLYLNFYFRLFFFFFFTALSWLPFSHTHHHLFFLLTNNGSSLFSGFHRPIWGSSWTWSSTVRWTKCPSSWKEASIQTTTTVTLVVRMHPQEVEAFRLEYDIRGTVTGALCLNVPLFVLFKHQAALQNRYRVHTPGLNSTDRKRSSPVSFSPVWPWIIPVYANWLVH